MMNKSYDELIGKVPVSILQDEWQILFKFSDGTSCMFEHYQDCCESVEVTDVNGDWEDLLNTPLLVADERTEYPTHEGFDDILWTFYTFRSLKGSVDVRWVGESNGWYSVAVSFHWIDEEEE